ncbi:MAG: ABC transporter substrate-binding protein, partial [Dehalococcoidia bacterium]
APTNDVRVRKALNYAIDRAAIVKSIFRGAAVPSAFFGFQPVKLEPYRYQPDEAKKLIDAAGARGTQLELVYGEGRIPEEDQLAEVYKAAFEAAGLRVNLKKVEPKQYNDIGTRPFPEQPPLYMETTSSGNYGEIAGGLADKYGCKGTGTFCKPEFDAEYAQLATLSGEARNAKLQSIAERLHNDEVPRVWVAAVQQVHGFADFVTVNLPANAYILFEDLKFG